MSKLPKGGPRGAGPRGRSMAKSTSKSATAPAKKDETKKEAPKKKVGWCQGPAAIISSLPGCLGCHKHPGSWLRNAVRDVCIAACRIPAENPA